MTARNAPGFALLEALICVLVLGIGFLGLANLQSRLWSASSVLHNTSQAYMLASSQLEQARSPWVTASFSPARTNAVTFAHDLTITSLEQLDRYQISVRWNLPSGQQLVELDTWATSVDPVDTRWLVSPR